MAELSKFYNITNQIMLEYVQDLYTSSETITTSPTEYTVYTAKDNTVYYTEKPRDLENVYSNPLYFIKFPDESDSEYTFLGLEKKNGVYTNEDILDGVNGMNSYIYNKTTDEGNMHYDKIRLHFIYGFLFDNLEGVTLLIKTSAKYLGPVLKYVDNSTTLVETDENGYPKFLTEVITPLIYDGDGTGLNSTVSAAYSEYERLVYDTADIVLLDIFFPKDCLSFENVVKWHTTPIYLNSRFYDRYIEFEVPSAYFLSLNAISNNIKLSTPNVYGYDLSQLYFIKDSDGNVEYYAKPATSYSDRKITYFVLDDPTIIINFSTVSTGNLTSVNADVYSSTFYLDPINQIALKYKSNSDYFNVRLLEDTNEDEIIYYPVFGEGDNALELNYEIFQNIENGTIPLLTEAFYDHMSNVNDFYETYGENAFKWIIYNEISVTYIYHNIIEQLNAETRPSFKFTDHFTNIIDYGISDPENAGDFWRTTYRPRVKQRNNMICDSILVEYVCRLINRLTSSEIIRKASLNIPNATKYNAKKISLDNIITYKIINQIKLDTITTLTVQTESKDKIIRSYYDATNLVIKDMGNSNLYTLGQMTLYLKKSSTNYVFRLYSMNDDNVRIPYDLTGPYRYLLTFPTNTGNKIHIRPNSDSNALNLGIGQLVFYISEENVKRIMLVSEDSRYFAIVTDTDNNDSELTTLYEGKVSYYS